MLSPLHFLLLAQLPVTEAGQLLLVIGIAFAVITLIASTYRFHRMIQLDDTTLETEEDRNNFFYVQTTRYLSKINRTSSGFGLFILQIQSEPATLRVAQEQALNAVRKRIRRAEDKACLYKEDCVGIIIDTEEERVADVAKRFHADLNDALDALPGVTGWRAGFSRFPAHGLTTREVNTAAAAALEAAATEGPAQINPAPDPEEPAAEEPAAKPALSELGKEDKNPALDPLTGVLRPKVVGSYMRKYMAELRRKKEPGTLLCVGINRIDQIISLHDEAAADDVIAGVSKILQNLTRDSDLIGRYHRDDFLVLAPCTLQEGEKIAERLRKAVQKEVFISSGKRIKASVSVGISAYPEHGRLLRDLFGKSHRALEILRERNSAACLVYDPAQHENKG
jgi:diguanylate cyclase (GGDEF)-like protein